MKRTGYLFEKISDIQTIKTAIHKAAKGKRKRDVVRKILANEDYYANEIKFMLDNGTYRPAPYATCVVRDGVRRKERLISKPHFYPDQIIHWCIYLTLQPVLFHGVYTYTCGSIPGRGVHYAKKYIERSLRHDRKHTKYYLQMDVRKFYPSIKIDILMDMLRRKIKDRRALDLIALILRRSDELPIGILLSQMFANFYLQDMDHFIKQVLGASHYVRYMDDMIIFGNSKRSLHKMRAAISEYLGGIGLHLKDNWQVRRTDAEPPDIAGFRFYRDRTILRKSVMLRITRKARKIAKKGRISERDAGAIVSYMGWLKCTDTYSVYEVWVKPYVSVAECKRVIKRFAKYRNEVTIQNPYLDYLLWNTQMNLTPGK